MIHADSVRSSRTLRRMADDPARFRVLIDAVVDYAIFMLDIDGRVVTWSAGAARAYGYSSAEMIGQPLDRLFTDEDRARGAPRLAIAAARRDGRYETEGWRLRKDGTRFWANVVIDPVRDETGAFVGFAKVTRDLTEPRHQQRKLDQTRDALHQAQKMEALGQLTGGIAHDFNNVLAAVMNNMELARRNPGSPGIRRHLDAALQAAQNGAGLVQQMLVFARKQPLRPQPVDANAAVESVVTMLRHGCPENIEIVTALDPAAPWVDADPHQLQTALLNVALNARDAMPEGGTLRIATAAEAHPPDARPGSPTFASISIVDTGLGMQPDVLAHAFEPFFTTKEIGKGTGLGLSMVYGAVRQLGGEVTLESVVGRGTTVRLFLPLAAAPAPQRIERGEVKTGGAPTGTPLLFVEDDAIVNMSATELLAEAGYRVYSAGRGDDALALLDSHPDIGLLVTDIGLPGMNGQELAKEARRRRPDLKVLFVTGYDHTGTIGQNAAEAGTLYIVKPYEPGQIFESLQRLTAGQGPASRR